MCQKFWKSVRNHAFSARPYSQISMIFISLHFWEWNIMLFCKVLFYFTQFWATGQPANVCCGNPHSFLNLWTLLGLLSVVLSTIEIWNRLKQFLPLCIEFAFRTDWFFSSFNRILYTEHWMQRQWRRWCNMYLGHQHMRMHRSTWWHTWLQWCVLFFDLNMLLLS